MALYRPWSPSPRQYTHFYLKKWSLLSMPLGFKKARLQPAVGAEPQFPLLFIVSPSQPFRKASSLQVCEGQPIHNWAGAGLELSISQYLGSKVPAIRAQASLYMGKQPRRAPQFAEGLLTWQNRSAL